MAGKQQGQDETEVNGDSTEERDRVQVHLARSGLIDHSEAQRQMANGHGQPQRRRQRNREHNNFGTNRHFYAVSTSDTNSGSMIYGLTGAVCGFVVVRPRPRPGTAPSTAATKRFNSSTLA